MKKSAWNQKLWLQKFEKLPVQTNANASWSKMGHLLDQQLPAANPSVGGTAGAKTVLAKLTGLLTYILPITIVMSLSTYFIVRDVALRPKPSIIRKVEKYPADMLKQLLVEKTHLAAARRINAADDLESIISHNNVKIDPGFYYKASVVVPVLPERVSELHKEIPSVEKSLVLISPVQQALDLYTEKAGPGLEESNPVGNSESLTAPPDVNSEESPLHVELRNLKTVKKRDKKFKANTRKEKIIRPLKQPKIDWPLPQGLQYGLSAGLNGGDQSRYYLGAFGLWQTAGRFALKAGLQYSYGVNNIGDFRSIPYIPLDSVATLSFRLSQNTSVIELPLSLTYRFGKRVSIAAGPMVSISVRKSAINASVLYKSVDSVNTDSLMNSTLSGTTTGNVNFGLRTGVSYHVRQLSFDLGMQWLSPNRFKNKLGTAKKISSRFQIGVSYQFR